MNNVRVLRSEEPDPGVTPGAADRKKQVLTMLHARQAIGMTWREVSAATGMGHGPVSGILSTLHQSGAAARLKDERAGSKVYVASEWVLDRQVERPKRDRRNMLMDDMAAVLRRVPTKCEHYYPDNNCRSCEIKRVLALYEERRQ